MLDHPVKVPFMGIDFSLDSGSAYCDTHYTPYAPSFTAPVTHVTSPSPSQRIKSLSIKVSNYVVGSSGSGPSIELGKEREKLNIFGSSLF